MSSGFVVGTVKAQRSVMLCAIKAVLSPERQDVHSVPNAIAALPKFQKITSISNKKFMKLVFNSNITSMI